MKIKLNRGPMKGKYVEVQDDYCREFVVQEAPSINWVHAQNVDPFTEIAMRRGTYVKSNVKLKNGAVVFEWMGWIDG